jgi:hypothetical protein
MSGYFMAGDEPHGSNPLLADFIVIGQKLELLGFNYSKGGVVLVDISRSFTHLYTMK